jgi:hypothetical protein
LLSGFDTSELRVTGKPEWAGVSGMKISTEFDFWNENFTAKK